MAENEYPREHVVPVEHEPRHHLVFANEFVRAFAVEIVPHDRTLCHYHAHEYLMYVAGEAQIVSAPRDQEPETHLYKDEECEVGQAGMVHVVENLADTKFRTILLEFLPKAAYLPRGRGPGVKRGNIVHIRQPFDDRLASVYAVSIAQDSMAAIAGPAILASPYGDEVAFIEIDKDLRKLSQFEDMAWLEPAQTAVVMRLATGSARALVFQLGMGDPQLSTVRKRTGEPLSSSPHG